jgi:thiol-disulfide isomerase/thioredoxin
MRIFLITTLLLIISFGLSAQDIPLMTIDQLGSRLNNGKDTTFVINFWATWCVPCRKEIPHFERLQREVKNTKVKVILLSLDNVSKANSAVKAYVKKQKLNNEVFVLNEPQKPPYFAKIEASWKGSLPATLMVNKAYNKRIFYENEFSWPGLSQQYNLFQE